MSILQNINRNDIIELFMNIKIPEGWRKGQTLFNFLEWVAKEKGGNNIQALRMADPFHIPDDKFEELYAEFLDLHK